MKTLNLIILICFTSFFIGCKDEDEVTSSQINTFKSSTSAVTFSILSYNVAGLPQVLSSADDREEYTPIIGELVNDYDIVNVQEDFNYHAYLYETDEHEYRTATSGGVPLGDGLNTMSNYSYTDFVRVAWDDCNGTDCLTPKGFSMLRVRMDEGVYIDIYNLHPNAHVTDEDLEARKENIFQLVDYINENSNGNAVMVFGDTNCRYTRIGDTIRVFYSDLDMTDPWIDLIKNGIKPSKGSSALVCADMDTILTDYDCETVDKVFYKGNNYINLLATECTYEDSKFRADDGTALSDHRPLYTEFKYWLNESMSLSDQFGGPHGTSFTDVNDIDESVVVKSIGIRSGSRLDQVNITFNNGTTLSHGSTGGTAYSLTLNDGEYIKSVDLCSGKYNDHTRIFYAQFTTNENRTISGGTTTDTTETYTAPDDWQIVGFHGRAGDEVDKLGVIYAPIN